MGLRKRLRNAERMEYAYRKGFYPSGATLGPGAMRAADRLEARRMEYDGMPWAKQLVLKVSRQIRKRYGI